MAIAATCKWEVQTGGSATNGGGYTSGGTDYSQQTSAQLALTDVVAAGTTTLTSVTGSFTAAMVGNIIYLEGGTGSLTATRREITGYTNSTTITVDATVATGTGITGNIGGCLSSPKDSLMAVIGNVVYIKDGTYTFTTAWTQNAVEVAYVGYNTNRTRYNLDTTRPLITTATNSIILITGSASTLCTYHNISFSNTAGTSASCFSGSSVANTAWAVNCLFDGFVSVTPESTNSNLQYDVTFYSCGILNCTTGIVRAVTAGIVVYDTYFFNCTNGIRHTQSGNNVFVQGCIFDTMSDSGIKLTRTTTSLPPTTIYDNVFYACAQGVYLLGNSSIVPTRFACYNNIFYGNTYDIRAANAITESQLVAPLYMTNAFGNNTNHLTNFFSGGDEITLTADPFVDAANDDFELNSTAGGGVLVRAMAYPTVFLGSSTTNYQDVGATQHEDAGGGGGQHSYSG